ncbi:MAG TPA: hypothetical protein VF114_00495 [Candidatus Limnocylindria bacterium]
MIFIGSYRIPEGAYDTFANGIRDMSAFVEADVPGVRLFHTYVNPARTEGTTIYVHPDGASLAQHLGAAAGRIDEGSQMVQVDRIQLLGSAPPMVVERLAEDRSYELVLQEHLAGFTR